MPFDRYSAPAKKASEFFGIVLHDTWGFDNHADMQRHLLPTGAVQDGYDEALVEAVASRFPNNENYFGFDRYHIALGMISQFKEEDILYFLNNTMSMRCPSVQMRVNAIEQETGFRLHWVPCPDTVEKLENYLRGI